MMKEKLQQILSNKTVRNGSLFSLFSFFEKGCNFVMLVVLAGYIDTDDYGRLGLFATVTMFFSYFVGLTTEGYLSVSYFRDTKEEFRRILTTIVAITLSVTSLIALCITPFIDELGRLACLPSSLLYLALVVAFARAFLSMLLNYLRVQERVVLYGVFACTNAVLYALIAIILVVPCRLGWLGSVYAQVAVPSLFALITIGCFIHWRLFDCSDPSLARIKTLTAWSIPLIPHMAAIWLRQGADRYIIEANHTMSDVGLFSFALTLTSVIIMIGYAFNSTFSVNIFQTLSSDLTGAEKVCTLKRQTRRITVVYILATLIVYMGVMAVTPFVLPRYAGALPYFTILTVYGLLQCIYLQYCNYLFYYKKTRNLMYITFGTSLLHVALSYCLTPYALHLTCATYIIIQTLIVLLVYVQSQRLIQQNLTDETTKD